LKNGKIKNQVPPCRQKAKSGGTNFAHNVAETYLDCFTQEQVEECHGYFLLNLALVLITARAEDYEKKKKELLSLM
jgi:hypothetical protein